MNTDRPSPQDQQLVSSFLEIAVGQTAETAARFLQATAWNLEEALQLFYVGNEAGVVAGSSLAHAAEGDVSVKEDAEANRLALGAIQEEEVRAPLPVKREALYDDAAYYRINPSSVVAFRNFEEESKQTGVWEIDQDAASTANSSHDHLASLYRPPFALMHHGPFDKAKVEASLQDKWLLVNLQSTEEFSSHMLNRDTWSNEAVEQTIRSNFIFWQVYNDTSEGKKVCTYYNLVSIPAVLIIDPITGQKMRTWNGMVHPERLLEDLLPYMDRGPKEHHVPPPRKRTRETSQMSTSNMTDKVSEDEEIRRAIASASLDERKKQKTATNTEEPMSERDNEGGGEKKEVIDTNIKEQKKEIYATVDMVGRPVYPPLPDEPQGDRSLLCRMAIRLPDGRRIQRNFLRTDPVQVLWSFCCSQLEEAKMRPFRFTQAIPRAPKCPEYESKLTLEESGLSNSAILLIWD